MSQSDYLKLRKTQVLLKNLSQQPSVLGSKNYTSFKQYNLETTTTNTKTTYNKLALTDKTNVFDMDIEVSVNCPTFECTNTQNRVNRTPLPDIQQSCFPIMKAPGRQVPPLYNSDGKLESSQKSTLDCDCLKTPWKKKCNCGAYEAKTLAKDCGCTNVAAQPEPAPEPEPAPAPAPAPADTTAPVITLQGDNPYVMTVGGTYSEAGGTADTGEQVVVASSNLDVNTQGSYTINYTATDAAGNVGTAQRAVTVNFAVAPADPNLLALTSTSAMNVVNDGGNKYLLNGETTYNALRTYGLSDGTYTITGVPSAHPVAIVSDLSQNIVYNGTSEETTPSNSIAGYTYYSGTVTITVNGDFQQASLHCSNHGYMGGENLLVYSS